MASAGRVLVIFSTKGGVGKTLIAANLASSLRVRLGRKAAVVELGGAKSDAQTLLGGTDVQCVSNQLTPDSLPGLIANLRATVEYVIVDAGSSFTDLAVAAFEHANLVVIVTTPDLLSIQHANRTIESLQKLRIPSRMLKVVINRAESRGNFRSAEVRGYLPVEVVAEIPSDGRLVGLAVNQGKPLVKLEEEGRITDAFRRLAKLFVENPAIFVEHISLDRSQLVLAPPEVSLGKASVEAASGPPPEPEDPIITFKRRIHSRLIEKFDLKRLDLRAVNTPQQSLQLKEKVEKVALELLTEESGFLPGMAQRDRLVKEIVEEALGLGPLEDLVADEQISDILVNGKDRIYIEKRGKLHLTDKKFVSNDQVLTVIERIVAPLGRRIDESSPMVDARLPDGSRFNAIIPPLSTRGPILSIRKFSRIRYTMEDLLNFGTLTREMAEFLRICVTARKNIIVSGGTGSGKTTTLNVLSACIPKDERIITIEDAAELRLDHEHWVPLESRPPNIEGKGQITVRHLFRNALRMRPDRIIIGECRGEETLDMLQAMNTGHDGSLTTLHANSPQDLITRMDSLVLMSNVELPVRAIREQIASAIHLVVHTARLSDGTRKVTHITEITGMDERADILFGDIFAFRQQGIGPNGEVLGEFGTTGHVPSFLDELRAKGFQVDESLFRR